jgi:hypothetical protein
LQERREIERDREIERSREIFRERREGRAATLAADMDADATKMPKKLWEHPNPESTDMYKFMQEVNQKYNLQLKVGM